MLAFIYILIVSSLVIEFLLLYFVNSVQITDLQDFKI